MAKDKILQKLTEKYGTIKHRKKWTPNPNEIVAYDIDNYYAPTLIGRIASRIKNIVKRDKKNV